MSRRCPPREEIPVDSGDHDRLRIRPRLAPSVRPVNFRLKAEAHEAPPLDHVLPASAEGFRPARLRPLQAHCKRPAPDRQKCSAGQQTQADGDPECQPYPPSTVRTAPAPNAASEAPSWWLAPIHIHPAGVLAAEAWVVSLTVGGTWRSIQSIEDGEPPEARRACCSVNGR